LDCIHRRHSDEFSESTGQTGDAVLAIKLTLVTVVRPAILAEHLATAADAIQALIDHDAIPFTQIAHRAANLFDDARDLMPENLRLQGEREGLAVLVCVVVCMTREDVDVSTAEPN